MKDMRLGIIREPLFSPKDRNNEETRAAIEEILKHPELEAMYMNSIRRKVYHTKVGMGPFYSRLQGWGQKKVENEVSRASAKKRGGFSRR